MISRIEKLVRGLTAPLLEMDHPLLIKCGGCGMIGVTNRRKPIKKQVRLVCVRCRATKVMKPLPREDAEKLPGYSQMLCAIKAGQDRGLPKLPR